MYIVTSLVLTTGLCGEPEVYQVGADVSHDEWCREPSVGEPDISAPCTPLWASRLADYNYLPRGWSNTVELALRDAFFKVSTEERNHG